MGFGGVVELFWVPCLVAGAVLWGFARLWRSHVRSRRENFIRTYRFPDGVYQGLLQKYPYLENKDAYLASRALRHFFLAHLKSRFAYVSMPSQAVDEVWHTFILNTKAYADFCKQAFGRFMHHTPAVAMGRNKKSNAGLRCCWWQACREENIDPFASSRLPLLFAIDAKLKITDGFFYQTSFGRSLKQESIKQEADGGTVIHWTDDFADNRVDGTLDGFGDCDGDSVSDCSSGDASDSGCGGGCGGGD